jgi:hypothetical protein
MTMTPRQKDLVRLALLYFEANVEDVMETFECRNILDEDKIPRPTQKEFNELFYLVK